MAEAVARLKITSDTAEAERGIANLENTAKKASDNIYSGFTKAGAALTAFAAAGAGAILKLAQGSMEGETALAQLNHAVVDVSGGTQETVKAFEDLATQLQANGVLNKDAIITGMAQLSTFGLSTDAVHELSGSMADLAVNQFGISASSDELTQTANMMAKALQGQFGVLEKSGIRFSEAQQEIILYGTEMEKVTAINEGFAQNLKFTNEVAMQTFAGQLENLKNKFGQAIEPLEDSMIPALTKLAETLGFLVDKISNLSPKTLEMIGKFLLITVAVTGILGPMLLLVGLIPSLVAGFTALGITIGLTVSPIYILMLTVTILTVMIVRSWDYLKEATQMFLDRMTELFTVFIDWISSVWTIFLSGISEVTSTVWNTIKDFLAATLETIKGMFNAGLSAIKTVFTFVWTSIKTFFVDVWEGMKGIVTSGLEFIVSTITGFYAAIKGAFQFIFDGAVGVVTGAVNVVVSTIKSMINGILSMVNKAIGGINALASAASAIPGVNIPKIPNIPYLAEGGVVTSPTLAMIGEGSGPEAVIPLNKFRGGFGGGEIHIHFEGPVSSREVAMEYADMITREFGFSNKMV